MKSRKGRLKMFDIAALGEILIDFTMQGFNTQGQRIFAQNPGGAPANVAAAVAKLGGKAAFLGKAGDDMHGHFLKDTLMSCNIDCTGFSLSKNYFTTLAFVDVKTNGEREFSFARNHGADKMLAVEEIPEDIITQSKILHIGSISLTDEPCRSATVYAVNTARQNGVIVSYDPNFRASLWKDKNEAINTMRSMIQYADLMKISEEETELLTGKADYTEAADILIGQGVKIVAVTLGKKGAFVRTEKGGILVKGFTNSAVDATGAGDAFWGGFLYKLAESGKNYANLRRRKCPNLPILETLQQAFALRTMVPYPQCLRWNRFSKNRRKRGRNNMSMDDNFTGIQHIGIPTNDIEATIAFYQKLGFIPVLRTVNEQANEKVAFLRLHNLTIETYENKAAEMKTGAIGHIAINCVSIEDAFSYINKEGLNTTSDTIHFLPFWEHGVRFFAIEGPNCEKIEFSQFL